MKIRLIEGLHITASDKSAFVTMLQNGWQLANTKQKTLRLSPDPERQGFHKFSISKSERDDWNRPVTRNCSGIIQAIA